MLRRIGVEAALRNYKKSSNERGFYNGDDMRSDEWIKRFKCPADRFAVLALSKARLKRWKVL